MKKIFLLCTLFAGYLPITLSQSNLLDPTFGANGLVKTDMGTRFNYTNFGKQVLVQPDGSVYLVFEAAGSDLMAKKHADGSPDITYGTNGYSVTVPVYDGHAVIQTDGKIVIAGHTTNPDYYSNQYDFALARFNTDGSLDNSFDSDGIKVTDAGSADFIHAIALEGNGKIVVAGATRYAPYFDVSVIALARYNIDGGADSTFGNNGIVTNRFGTIQYANSVAVQDDGKIVIGGFIDVNSVLVRYNIDGTIDSSFNGTGIKSLDWGTDGLLNAIALQTDNKIIAAGNTSNSSNDNFILARFNTDGSPDNSFDGGGLQTTDFTGTGDTLTSIALQSDGKIMLAGYTSQGGNNYFAIARYTPAGSLDGTFDGDGKQTTGFGTSNGYASSTAIQSDGKLVALGYTVDGINTYIAASRYNNDGSPDNSFNGNGMLVDHINEGDTHYTGTAIQSDGKIVAAGYTWNGNNYDFAVVRYNTDGSPDNTFSGDGEQITDMDSADTRALAVAIQGDGKIVVAGYTWNGSNYDFALVRYTTDGSVDHSFSGDGMLTADFGSSDFINSLAIQSDGKILAGGSALARYNTDGSPDAGFNGNGELAISFTCNGIAIQTDGKIVAAGNYGGDAMVARYNTDGSTDSTFGIDGLQDIVSYGEGELQTGRCVAIQSDGKIVVGGSSEATYRFLSSIFELIRLNTDGNLDETFGSGGFAYANPGPSGLNYGNSVSVQSDNKIILAGSSYNMSNDNFAILRFNANGTLDNTFSGDGIEITSASTAYNSIAAIAPDDDKLYAVGYGQYPGNFGVVAKYLVSSGGSLPVALTDFTAALKNKSVLLQWQTATEHNLSHFIIQRSNDGNTFPPVGNVVATGNSSRKINYSTLDQQPLKGVNFYRLKIVDIDGKFTYSKTVAININQLFSLSIFPNPAGNNLFVQANGENEKATFQIIDAAGRKLKEGTVILNGNTSFSIYINNLSKGTYHLQLNTKTKIETRGFIKE